MELVVQENPAGQAVHDLDKGKLTQLEQEHISQNCKEFKNWIQMGIRCRWCRERRKCQNRGTSLQDK